MAYDEDVIAGLRRLEAEVNDAALPTAIEEIQRLRRRLISLGIDPDTTPLTCPRCCGKGTWRDGGITNLLCNDCGGTGRAYVDSPPG